MSELDVTIITGMSGAGRSAAADVLEDLGFFVIDNLPPALIGKVAELGRGSERSHRYALVVDVRSGEFIDDLQAALPSCARAVRAPGCCFLDAGDDVLVRRFEATRRRHPLASTDRVLEGIPQERALLGELKGQSDVVLDTSNLNVHELRDRLVDLFARGARGREQLQVSIVTFGYKHGLPLDVDLVFDCRFLPNPHWVEELRPLTGADAAGARATCSASPRRPAFLDELERLFALLLPAFEREGKAYLSIGIGCTGGRHRSVVIAEGAREAPRPAGLLVAASTTGTSPVSDGR